MLHVTFVANDVQIVTPPHKLKWCNIHVTKEIITLLMYNLFR